LVDLLAYAESGAIVVHPYLELFLHEVQEVVQFRICDVQWEAFSKEDGAACDVVGHVLEYFQAW
jgi:hypothetical protein